MKILLFILIVLPSVVFADSCPSGFVAYEYDSFVPAVSGACPIGYVSHSVIDVCGGDTVSTCWLVEKNRELCAFGFSDLKTSTGLSFPMYSDKITTPSIYIKYNDSICYVDLEQGRGVGTINVNYDGIIYHAIK